MIVVRLPPLESSNAIHQLTNQDKEDFQIILPLQQSSSVQGARMSQQCRHEEDPAKKDSSKK